MEAQTWITLLSLTTAPQTTPPSLTMDCERRAAIPPEEESLISSSFLPRAA